MLKWLMHRRLSAFERAHGYDASYLHEVLNTDRSAYLAFTRATGLGKYRKDVPRDLYAAASLTASLAADCGPCTQLGVGFALQSGVETATLAAIIRGDERAMSPDAALGMRFAQAVLARDARVDALREAIARRWGPRAVLALAYGMMAAQMYPTLKYALGHGKACTRVLVAGHAIEPGPRLAAGAT